MVCLGHKQLVRRVDGFELNICPSVSHSFVDQVLIEEAGLNDALTGEVPRLAQRLWTSDKRFGGAGVPPALQREFCSLINAVLRGDDPALLCAAMPLIRAINSLCVVRGARPEKLLRFPHEHRCFRGGGLPDEHRGFFVSGVKYRVPGFLATSFDREARSTLAWPGLVSSRQFDLTAGYLGLTSLISCFTIVWPS
jgi:hypothetical protein